MYRLGPICVEPRTYHLFPSRHVQKAMTRRQNPWISQRFWEGLMLKNAYHFSPQKMGSTNFGNWSKSPEVCFDTCDFSKYQQHVLIFFRVFWGRGRGGVLWWQKIHSRPFSPKDQLRPSNGFGWMNLFVSQGCVYRSSKWRHFRRVKSDPWGRKLGKVTKAEK